MKICLGGVTGWTGSAVAEAIVKDDGLELTAALSRSRGGSVSEIAGAAVPVFGRLEEALQEAAFEIYVDYTSAQAVYTNVRLALEHGLYVVVGSSGLTEAQYRELEALALSKQVGMIACGNFSITAALAIHFSLLAARYLPNREIIDYASASKSDAPSGTTRELAERLAATPCQQEPLLVQDQSSPGRGADIAGTRVHSLRLPGYTLAFDAVFSNPEERLVISHAAGKSAAPYVDGTLLAISKVRQIKGLCRGMDKLLFQ
ncbi:MAG: 4-hydroxy-tetrahydrodipicolinate reductase [Candidatus Obscuribacterales bacterium]|nr:4-hydroxy-tetrahydrodipicolinate reductase [Candidatus Obscuribacterales bacterium]